MNVNVTIVNITFVSSSCNATFVTSCDNVVVTRGVTSCDNQRLLLNLVNEMESRNKFDFTTQYFTVHVTNVNEKLSDEELNVLLENKYPTFLFQYTLTLDDTRNYILFFQRVEKQDVMQFCINLCVSLSAKKKCHFQSVTMLNTKEEAVAYLGVYQYKSYINFIRSNIDVEKPATYYQNFGKKDLEKMFKIATDKDVKDFDDSIVYGKLYKKVFIPTTNICFFSVNEQMKLFL